MNWTDFETIIVQGRDFAVMGDDLGAVTFSRAYLADKCTPITEARARKLDPALVAYMEQPE